uniref:Uncharacterized protein n=2 Tax=Caenorhabditis japonica TaxID=281687 RepID=A0A8R1I8I6_CAEJA
ILLKMDPGSNDEEDEDVVDVVDEDVVDVVDEDDDEDDGKYGGNTHASRATTL